MKYTDAKKDYIKFLEHEQGATKTTIVTYQSWLNRYERWQEEEGFESAEIDVVLSYQMLRRFQYALVKTGGHGGHGARPRTIRGAFNALRGLCSFLIREKIMDKDPTKELTLPKFDAAKRLLISDEEVQNLLLACERQNDERKSAFDLALMSSLVHTGLRAQEILDLKLGDLNVSARKLTVAQGKGKKARTLVPPTSFWRNLAPWLAVRNKMNCTHDWLWAQDKARRISYDWLLAQVNDIAARAGYKGAANIKPHSLRHWFATHMLRNGATILQIKAALGHSDMKTTMLYLHLNEADAEAMAIHAEFDPFTTSEGRIESAKIQSQKQTVPNVRTSTPVVKSNAQTLRRYTR